MKVLGLIPARGGSVRCPRKNLAMVGRLSLLGWAIAQARESGVIDEIAVTTDDTQIAAEARNEGAPALIRPARLAQDDTPMAPVIQHALQNIACDVLVLLQPTSPLRTADDIRGALRLFERCGADAVISVTAAKEDLVFNIGHAGRLRPRGETTVEANGAIYIGKAEALLRGESFYDGLLYGYPMPKDRSVDIDTPQDLEIARMIISGRIAA